MYSVEAIEPPPSWVRYGAALNELVHSPDRAAGTVSVAIDPDARAAGGGRGSGTECSKWRELGPTGLMDQFDRPNVGRPDRDVPDVHPTIPPPALLPAAAAATAAAAAAAAAGWPPLAVQAHAVHEGERGAMSRCWS